MNKKEKEIEYQKGLTELYEKTQEMGRGDFVKMIYDLKEELDIANKKLEKIEEHCNKSIEYEEREIKMLSEQHNKFDHLRIIRNNNEILKIIGGE